MSAVLICAAVAVVALAGLLGRTGAPTTLGRVVVLAVPVIVAAGAVIAPFGFTLLWAVVVVAVAVIALLAARTGVALRAVEAAAGEDAPWGTRALVSVFLSFIALVFAAVAVRWLAPQVTAITGADDRAIVVVIVLGATAASVVGGARRELARAGLVILVVAAVLALVAGLAAGKAGYLLAPVVPVNPPSTLTVVLGLLAVLIGGSLHPGIARLARESSAGVLKGVVAAGLIMLLGLIGVMALLGGTVQFPSGSLSVVAGYITYAPLLVGTLLGAVLAFLATVMAAAGIDAALTPWSGLKGTPGELGGWFQHRWAGRALAGAVLLALCLSPVSGVALLDVVGLLGLCGWVGWTRLRRPADLAHRSR